MEGVTKANKDKDGGGGGWGVGVGEVKYGRSHTKSKIYPGRERVK